MLSSHLALTLVWFTAVFAGDPSQLSDCRAMLVPLASDRFTQRRIDQILIKSLELRKHEAAVEDSIQAVADEEVRIRRVLMVEKAKKTPESKIIQQLEKENLTVTIALLIEKSRLYRMRALLIAPLTLLNEQIKKLQDTPVQNDTDLPVKDRRDEYLRISQEFEARVYKEINSNFLPEPALQLQLAAQTRMMTGIYAAGEASQSLGLGKPFY